MCVLILISKFIHSPLSSLCVLVTQLCLTLCNPMECGTPGSSIHGIFQARILGLVTISFSRGYSWPRDWTHLLRCRQTLPSEQPGKPFLLIIISCFFFFFPTFVTVFFINKFSFVHFFLDFTCMWYHIFVLLYLTSLIIMKISGSIHVTVKGSISFISMT